MGFNELYKRIMCENNVDDDDRINIEKKINEYTGLSSDEYKLKVLIDRFDTDIYAICMDSKNWDYLVFSHKKDVSGIKIYDINEITFNDLYNEVGNELGIDDYFDVIHRSKNLIINIDNSGRLNIILRIELRNESIEFSNKLSNLLKKSELDIPNKEYNFYKKFDIDDKGNIIASDGRHSNIMKIGNFITTLYPDLKSDNKKSELNKIIGKIRSNLSSDGYEFIIDDDVSGCYASGDIPKSCMTGKRFVSDFYKSQPDIKVLKLLFNGRVIGRALLWSKVIGAKGGIFLDRIYPTDDDKIINMFHDYAKKNDWSYRWSNDINNYLDIKNCETTKLFFKLNDKGDIDRVPYLDTFRFGFYDNDFITNDEHYNDYKFANIDGVSINKWENEYRILSIDNLFDGLRLLNDMFSVGSDYDQDIFNNVLESDYESEEKFLDMYPDNFTIDDIVYNFGDYELIKFFLSKYYIN